MTFSNLILRYDLVLDFYLVESASMLAAYRIFWRLCRDNCPLLYMNLLENEATGNMLLQPWVTTLFANSFDVEICAVLWD